MNDSLSIDQFTKLMDQKVSYNSGDINDTSLAFNKYNIGDTTQVDLTYGWYKHYYDWCPWHDRSITYYTKTEDDYAKAFRIAKMLLKKKLLSSRKLKDFIQLVEEIAREI